MTTLGGPVRVAGGGVPVPAVRSAPGSAVAVASVGRFGGRFEGRFAGALGLGIRSGVSGEVTAEA